MQHQATTIAAEPGSRPAQAHASCPFISGPAALSRPALIASWVLQLTVAGIFLQTLFFKFTAAPESVEIFTKLGMEPWGRLGSGAAELLAAILLLWPRFVSLGAALALGVISGAIMSHLTVLGISVRDDGGLLFGMALLVFAASAAVALLRRRQLALWVARLRARLTSAR